MSSEKSHLVNAGQGRLVVTLGDPLSVNIEALLRLSSHFSHSRKILILGSKWQLQHQASIFGLKVPSFNIVKSVDEADLKQGWNFYDPLPDVGHKSPRELSSVERGQLMVASLNAVPKDSDSPLAVLTCPIDKAAAVSAGFSFPGQTEFFEALWKGKAVMLLAGPKLRVALATNHVALEQVTQQLSVEKVQQKICILAEGLSALFGINKPRIAVCGVNPHCGDKGLFGDEDQKIVGPAVVEAQSATKDALIYGPVPADTAFYRAYHGQFDAVLAMYHDQGLGPLKTVHFDEAVNVSLGLKHLRVSPDHGPAADLYGTASASLKSFQAALTICEEWLSRFSPRK